MLLVQSRWAHRELCQEKHLLLSAPRRLAGAQNPIPWILLSLLGHGWWPKSFPRGGQEPWVGTWGREKRNWAITWVLAQTGSGSNSCFCYSQFVAQSQVTRPFWDSVCLWNGILKAPTPLHRVARRRWDGYMWDTQQSAWPRKGAQKIAIPFSTCKTKEGTLQPRRDYPVLLAAETSPAGSCLFTAF